MSRLIPSIAKISPASESKLFVRQSISICPLSICSWLVKIRLTPSPGLININQFMNGIKIGKMLPDKIGILLEAFIEIII